LEIHHGVLTDGRFDFILRMSGAEKKKEVRGRKGNERFSG
jgi:hypothetical protein